VDKLCDVLIKDEQSEENCALFSALSHLTASRQAKEQESRALAQKERLLDQVSIAIIGADLNGIIKAWNLRAESVFGFKAEDAIGQPLSLVFQNGSGKEFSVQKILEPLLIRDRHQFEADIRRRDGGALPVHASLSLERNAKGDIVGVICCCRDISLRRRVEGERRDAYQRLTFFLERMPLGFIEWGLDYQIRAWNQSAEEIFGYSQKEALGQPIGMLLKDEPKEECRQLYQKMREEKGACRSRNENITRDGRVIICDWNITVLMDAQGEVIGFASIVEDITEPIRIEEELKESREAARAANRSKDEFLAVMSHEVRTPMNSIIGFADLLMESLKDQEETELVNIIKANAFNLLELISNVLNYSRLEAGEVTLKEQETDLQALCLEIREVTQAEAQEKNLEFEIDLKTDTPQTIIADYSELRQVLLNLTANALKFTEEGGITITISAKQQPSDSPWGYELLFAVKDTGIGIDKEKQDRLFQSFTQLDSSSTRRFGGTGLGLAICRRIVELWDGNIWAESNRGQGSTFYFTMPTHAADRVRDDASDHLYEEIEDKHFAEIYPLNILLITPTIASAEVAQRIICSLGYKLQLQYDAIEAISHMQDHTYDIVLIDDQLNDFSLAEMVEIISQGQAGDDNRKARMVVFSDTGPHNKETSSPFGSKMVYTIAKPIIARNVRQMLRRLAISHDSEQSSNC